MRFLATLALSCVAFPAFGGTFHYKIDDVPADGDCHARAAALGEAFERVTHVRPDSALCTDITNTAFAFDVTYTADARLELISTVESSSMSQSGAFRTRDACEAMLPSERSHFEEVTGLTAVIAYCEIFDLSREVSYDLRIDSFGAPAMRPFHADPIIFDRPVDMTLPDFQRIVLDTLRQRDVDARYAAIRSSGPYANLDVLYYATEPFELDAPELASLETRQQCDEQLGLARAARPGRAEAPVALYCAQSMISSYYVIGLFRDLPGDSERFSAERFQSYAACQAQRDALVAEYNQRLGQRVTAGLCSRDRNLVWRVKLLLH